MLKKLNKTLKNRMSVSKRGFTLVEILVVIVVIGLLFMFFVPRIDFAGDKARETGVKSDFRSFSLAAEQLLRENAGLSNHETLAKFCAANNGVNLYVDPAMVFSATGECAQNDPWNKPYTVQVVGATAGNNNGGVIFLSGGKDGVLDGKNDYAIGVVFVDGALSTSTTGFSSDIKSELITNITNGAAGGFTLSGGTVSLQYKK